VAPESEQPSASKRLAALDVVRGLIIALMALDHASMFIAEQHFGEFWGVPLPDYGDGLSLLTRVVSHLCAPGFFLLMGAGMLLFSEARRARGWTDARIAKHFMQRGAILVVLEFVLVNPAWILGSLEAILRGDELAMGAVPGGGGIPYLTSGVLAALGASMLVSGPLMRLGARRLAVLALLLLLACSLLLPDASDATYQYPVLARVLLVAGQTGPVMVIYPLMPWLAICLLGASLGGALRADARRTLRALLPIGGVCLLLFLGVRVIGGFGTYHAMPSGDWMGLLSVTKYPPSLAYLLLTLGMNALLLFAAARFMADGSRVGAVLQVFGKTPLFFYITHLYVYALLGLAIPGKTPLVAMYAVWLLGLALLYPACQRYAVFKSSKGDTSVWRLF
jgi:uncharacterized membrane protein